VKAIDKDIYLVKHHPSVGDREQIISRYYLAAINEPAPPPKVHVENFLLNTIQSVQDLDEEQPKTLVQEFCTLGGG